MRRLKKCSGRSTKLRKSTFRKDEKVIDERCRWWCLDDDGGGGRDEDDDDDKNAYFSFSQFSLAKFIITPY